MKRYLKYNIWIVWIILLAFCWSCGKSYEVEELSIIPEPVSVVQKARSFTLKKDTKLCFSNIGQNSQTAKYITKSLRQMHFRPRLVGRPHHDCIVFEINDTVNSEIGREGYVIDVRPDEIRISANSEEGLFYGYQTFIQMLPDDIARVRYSSIVIPECLITDYPRFEWRGCELDVSRHFFSVKSVKKMLDVMAAYKMNKFHWHLTNDHGWRIEIEKYPRLNTIGSWSVDRTDVPWGEGVPSKPDEPRSYGGYYTKAEIAEVVAYAAERHIDVIPEVCVPGHASAILAAYPQFACRPDSDYEVRFGPYWPPLAILCAGNDSVLVMLKEVLDEVVAMFPYEYIHLGGDEAVYDEWEECPKCQARMRANHLTKESQLQGWLIGELSDYLATKGRHIIGWDEILDGRLRDGDVVMSWRGMQGGIAAVRSGHKAIMSPTDYCYFDYYQADPKYQPVTMGHQITMEKVYKFDPMPQGITEKQEKLIMGGQCNLWTEYINNWNYAEYMLLPRLCAMSEDLWTPKDRKDWPLFQRKLQHHKARLASNSYNYCEGSFKPLVKITPTRNGLYQVVIETEVYGTYVYYTLDGSMPTLESETYTEPLQLKKGTVLRVRSVYDGLPKEGVYEYVVK